MSSVGLNSGLSARKASTRVAEQPSSQPFFKHLWPPLALLSLGRRLRTPLGLPGMESSQRPGVERPWGAVPGSGTLGHLCYVDFYGLIYDQASCALWSFLPATLAARTKSKPSKWVLVASLSTPKLHLSFLCVLLVGKFKRVLCHDRVESVLDESSPSCKALPCCSVTRLCVFRSGSCHGDQGDSPGQARVKLWLPCCLQGGSWPSLEIPCPILTWIFPQIGDLWRKPCPT